MEDDRDTELEEGRMPLLDHLIELRNRLMWSIGAIMVAFLVCYQFKIQIYGFLVHPLAVIFTGQTGRHLIYTGLTRSFVMAMASRAPTVHQRVRVLLAARDRALLTRSDLPPEADLWPRHIGSGRECAKKIARAACATKTIGYMFPA